MGFESSFRKLVNVEGGYSDDQLDSGGKTRWGITEGLARKHGYKGVMAVLPLPLAKSIYRFEFWDKLMLESVSVVDDLIADELFDTAVNQGAYRAAVYLQRSLNVLNDRERLYSDLIVDGAIGQKTMNALHSFVQHRGDDGLSVLLNMLNCLQGAFYVELAEQREKDERFIFGWFASRVVIEWGE